MKVIKKCNHWPESLTVHRVGEQWLNGQNESKPTDFNVERGLRFAERLGQNKKISQSKEIYRLAIYY